jgi:hypothetical protein
LQQSVTAQEVPFDTDPNFPTQIAAHAELGMSSNLLSSRYDIRL